MRFSFIRDTVIQKWFERTRGFTKQNKNSLVEQSPTVQVKEVNIFLYTSSVLQEKENLYLDNVITRSSYKTDTN